MRKREMERTADFLLFPLSSLLTSPSPPHRDLYIPWAFRLFGLIAFERQAEQQQPTRL